MATGKRAGSRATSKTNQIVRQEKANAARAAKPRRRDKPPLRDPLEQFLEAAASALDLPVEPAWKTAVSANLEVTLRFAKLV
jgi:hypothetical protein